MTIFATSFDIETLEPTSHSADSGFVTLKHVIEIMGAPLKQTGAFLIYPGGILFSRIAWYLGPSINREPG